LKRLDILPPDHRAIHEHDLRGKVGSDAESLERARQLLGHADTKITERVYRRKPEVVRPLR
jgi:integrase